MEKSCNPEIVRFKTTKELAEFMVRTAKADIEVEVMEKALERSPPEERMHAWGFMEAMASVKALQKR